MTDRRLLQRLPLKRRGRIQRHLGSRYEGRTAGNRTQEGGDVPSPPSEGGGAIRREGGRFVVRGRGGTGRGVRGPRPTAGLLSPDSPPGSRRGRGRAANAAVAVAVAVVVVRFAELVIEQAGIEPPGRRITSRRAAAAGGGPSSAASSPSPSDPRGDYRGGGGERARRSPARRSPSRRREPQAAGGGGGGGEGGGVRGRASGRRRGSYAIETRGRFRSSS